MNKMSKAHAFIPKKNLTTLKPSPDPKKLQLSSLIPEYTMSNTYYRIDRDPPVKSNKMLMIDQPWVDFRLQFK